MSNFLLQHYDSDSSADEDYNPLADPNYKESQTPIKPAKSPKSQAKTQENLSKIWSEMNFKPKNEEISEEKSLDYLNFAKDLIKKQEEELRDLKTVVFAGSEYLVDKTGTLRLKTIAEQEKNKKEETNSSNDNGNLSILTNSEGNGNNMVIEAFDAKEDLKKRFGYLKKILEKINNRPKVINAVKKSKMDWKQYAKKEHIEDRLEKNRRNGLLTKQNFLGQVKENEKNLNSEVARKKVHI